MAVEKRSAGPLAELTAGARALATAATAPARGVLRLFAVAASAVGEPAELEMLVRARLLD